jgi:undecaprenyl diphosphate synthase
MAATDTPGESLAGDPPVNDAGLPQHVPRHVAIIMDGNGRWAIRKGLPRSSGHERGVEVVRAILEAAGELGIEVLTLYTFSTDNWRRPAAEVSFLMGMLARFLSKDRRKLVEKSVRLRVIGEVERLPARVRRELERTIAETSSCLKQTLVLALSYGAHEEIARAARLIAAASAGGELSPNAVDVSLLSRYLYTKDLPEPDLLIRTGGEMRLSNFLLWQLSYTELWFTETCWPDFTASLLKQAVADYGRRKRTFGTASARPAG